MVRGKPSSRLDRGVDIPFTLSVGIGFIIMLRNTTTSRDKVRPWSPVVGESDHIHKPERKVNGCLGMTRRCSRRVCWVILARLNFDSESSASHDEMRLLDLFATQSNKSNNILINLNVCLEVPPCLISRCLH